MDSNTLLNISKNMQDLTLVLTHKNYNRIGALSNIDQNSIVYKKKKHGKELTNIKERVGDEHTDFKLVWLKETNE